MKLYQKYLAFMLLILFMSMVYFYIKNKQEFVDRINIVLINMLEKKIDIEKEKAFSFAFALSQNETLLQAIENKNNKKSYEILNRYMSTLESFSGFKVHTQIISNEFVILARSWDNSDAGLNVKEFRPDLEKMLITKKPQLSFQAARRLVLIASIPVIKENKVIGFVEVIQHFEPIEKYFASFDMDLIVLLDETYQNQSILLSENTRIKNNIVVNDAANINHIKYLQENNIEKLFKKGTLKSKNHFYFLDPIINTDGKNIGSIVLIISKKKLELFNSFEEELDTFFTYARKDLYYSVIGADPTINIYRNMTSKELLSLRKSTHKEDSIMIQEILIEQLQSYTKDELISLLIDVNTNKKLRGKIK